MDGARASVGRGSGPRPCPSGQALVCLLARPQWSPPGPARGGLRVKIAASTCSSIHYSALSECPRGDRCPAWGLAESGPSSSGLSLRTDPPQPPRPRQPRRLLSWALSFACYGPSWTLRAGCLCCSFPPVVCEEGATLVCVWSRRCSPGSDDDDARVPTVPAPRPSQPLRLAFAWMPEQGPRAAVLCGASPAIGVPPARSWQACALLLPRARSLRRGTQIRAAHTRICFPSCSEVVGPAQRSVWHILSKG